MASGLFDIFLHYIILCYILLRMSLQPTKLYPVDRKFLCFPILWVQYGMALRAEYCQQNTQPLRLPTAMKSRCKEIWSCLHHRSCIYPRTIGQLDCVVRLCSSTEAIGDTQICSHRGTKCIISHVTPQQRNSEQYWEWGREWDEAWSKWGNRQIRYANAQLRKASLTAHTMKTSAGLTTSGKLNARVLQQPLSLPQLEDVLSKHQVNSLVTVGAGVENSQIFWFN